MPRIFDNIDLPLLPALQDTLRVSNRADFCVGYINLRGWRKLDQNIENWAGGDGNSCRLLVGMQKALPKSSFGSALSIGAADDDLIDTQTAHRLRKKLAEELRDQLTIGFQTNEDEAGLREVGCADPRKKSRRKAVPASPTPR